jgi:RNA recognition motif-containing protein
MLLLDGSQCSPERKTRSVDNPDVLVRSVYVSGLAWSTTKEALAAHFNQIGPVEKATILYRSRRGKTVSLGCGVVEFCTPELAARAVSHMGTSELEGRSIRCREDRSVDSSSGDTTAGSGGARASPDAAIASPLIGGGKGAHQEPSARVLDPKRVFITSLAFDATQADLLELVSPLGVVVSAEIQYTRKGRSLGHAVVEFAEPAAAQLAVGTLDGRVVHGRTIIVRPYYKD